MNLIQLKDSSEPCGKTINVDGVVFVFIPINIDMAREALEKLLNVKSS